MWFKCQHSRISHTKLLFVHQNQLAETETCIKYQVTVDYYHNFKLDAAQRPGISQTPRRRQMTRTSHTTHHTPVTATAPPVSMSPATPTTRFLSRAPRLG